MAYQVNTAKLTIPDKRPDWSFYIAWIFLTTLCLPAAYLVVILLLRIVTSFVGDTLYVNGVQHITEDYLALYFLVPIMGLVTGAAQYGMLRRVLPNMGWWVLSTVGGWLLGALLSIAIRLLGMEQFNIGLAFLLLGGSIGFGQWLVLRKRLPRAGWWIAANMIGWAVLLLFTKGNAVGQAGLLVIGFGKALTKHFRRLKLGGIKRFE